MSTKVSDINHRRSYEDSYPLILTLTFFTVTYVKTEESNDDYGPVRLTSKKTKRSVKIPFDVIEAVVKKLPLAVDRCNGTKPQHENDSVIFEERFSINSQYVLSLMVTTYESRNFIFLKPLKFAPEQDKFIPQLGNVPIYCISCIVIVILCHIS